MQSLQIEKEAMKNKLLDKKYRSMRENLIFYGIPESTGSENMEESVENCETVVKDFIKEHIKINATDMKFDRSHGLG